MMTLDLDGRGLVLLQTLLELLQFRFGSHQGHLLKRQCLERFKVLFGLLKEWQQGGHGQHVGTIIQANREGRQMRQTAQRRQGVFQMVDIPIQAASTGPKIAVAAAAAKRFHSTATGSKAREQGIGMHRGGSNALAQASNLLEGLQSLIHLRRCQIDLNVIGNRRQGRRDIRGQTQVVIGVHDIVLFVMMMMWPFGGGGRRNVRSRGGRHATGINHVVVCSWVGFRIQYMVFYKIVTIASST